MSPSTITYCLDVSELIALAGIDDQSLCTAIERNVDGTVIRIHGSDIILTIQEAPMLSFGGFELGH